MRSAHGFRDLSDREGLETGRLEKEELGKTQQRKQKLREAPSAGFAVFELERGGGRTQAMNRQVRKVLTENVRRLFQSRGIRLHR